MSEINAETIRALAAERINLQLTLHLLDRCRQRGITIEDVKNVLLHGEIIEQYPNDYPYPSCLELGLSISGRYLHVCCGVGDNKLWLITAYYPTEDEWEPDMKTRKVVD